MTAEQRRGAVTWLRRTRHVSERRARRLAGISASSYRYVSQRGVADHPVRQRLRALAELRPRWGSPRLHWLLVREGLVVNHKRTERLYREERFAVTRRRRRKRVSAPRVVPPAPVRPTERWSMDFVRDTLADGRPFRAFTLVDDFTTSRLFDAWAYRRGIKLLYIRPGKPVENAFIESFNGKLRDECLSTSWFLDLADARAQIEHWRHDYNTARPHSALDDCTPSKFARDFARATPSTDP